MASLKDLKSQLNANKKVLRKVNKPQQNEHYHTFTDKDLFSEVDEQEKTEQSKTEIDSTGEYGVPKQSFLKALLQQKNNIQKQLKKKKKHKATKNGVIIATFILPIIMIFTILILTMMMISTANLNNAAATIASLVDPKERAILKARGLLEDNAITEVPKELVGNLPGSAGFDLSSNDKSDKDGSDDVSISNANNPKSIAKSFWAMAKAKGYTMEQAAAVLGNWQMESGINVMRVESDGPFGPVLQGMKTTAGYSGGFGLAQWTAGRNHNLYAKYPKSFTTVKSQIEFFFSEKTYNMGSPKNNPYLGGSSAAHSVDAATTAVMFKWEAPLSHDTLSKRIGYAHKWYSYLKGLK